MARSMMITMTLLIISTLLAAVASGLSVEVKITGDKVASCRGIITFVALDSDCGDCLYGVKSFKYASVKCRTDQAALQCCKTITKKW
jgi:hypothetical protein